MKKYLLVGLGNIGPEYENTRHNIGFRVAEAMAQMHEAPFATQKLGDLSKFRVKGRQVILLKPSTYMNRSGKALRYWMEQEKIPLEHVLVITDDINLPFGTLRMKTKGSDGGHNGLKDIQQQLNSATYTRLRFGVGADFQQGRQVDYVLGQWDEEEQAKLSERVKRAAEMALSFVLAGPKTTMNEFNNT